MQYVGYQAEIMLQEAERDAFDEEKEMIKRRYDKIKEIKSLCRFCFSNGKDVKCISMNKLYSYNVDPIEMINFLGLNQTFNEAFNEIICGNCFDRFLEFSNYRKRCQTSQKEIIESMQELDKKILEIQQLQRYQRNPATNWLKVELEDDDQIAYEDDFYDIDTEKDENSQNSEGIVHTTVVTTGENVDDFDNTDTFIEEHLDDDDRADDFITEEIDPNESGENDSQLFQINIKNEPLDLEYEQKTSTRKSTKRSQIDENSTPKSSPKKRKSTPKTSKATPKKAAIKVEKKDRNSDITIAPGIDSFRNKSIGSLKKIHECFFCRQKFVGKKEYKDHKCNKRIKCEFDGCELYFVNQGGYNIHIQRKHALPKVSRHLCPVCKTNYHMNALQFDEHCKKCIEENEYKEQPIKCEKCSKMFKSLQSFTAHTMFHDEESLKKATNDTMTVPDPKAKNIRHMCDLCGRVFKESYGLRRHQSDVHYLDFTGQMFYCDLCPIAKPTKRLLYNHMKSTHIIRWHSCEICGKIFKNRELWRKHQLVHGDFKKNNLCDYCPHRPGFVTATALRKHLARHHGGAEPNRRFLCDIPNCGAAYSRDDQLTRHRVSVHQIYHDNYNESIIKHYVNG